MKTFQFSLVLRTREYTDVFITLDENIYGIHNKRVNIFNFCFFPLKIWNRYVFMNEKYKLFLLPSEKGSTLKGNTFLPMGENSFRLE